MATNTFVQARDVVDIGVTLLQKDLTLAGLFFKDPNIDWSGRPNDTVTVRVPARLSAARRFGTGWRPDGTIGPNDGTAVGSDTGAAYDPYASAPNATQSATAVYGNRPAIRVDTVGEFTTTLTIDEFIYKALGVTLEDLTLSTTDFVSRYLPQMTRVVAERIDAKCLAQLGATHWLEADASGTKATDLHATVLAGDDSDADAKIVIKAINTARRTMDANFVPKAGRTLVMGLGVEDALVLSDKFQRYDSVGSDSALRTATIGRVLGMDVVSSADLADDEMFTFSSGAFLLNTVTPREPDGAVQAATASSNGYSCMYIQDYDTQHAIDRVMVSLFAGTGAVEDGPVESGHRTMVRATRTTFDTTTP